MKRSKEQIQVQVGAFLAMGILLFMAAIFMLGSKQNLFQSQYTLVCYFDDISGLRIGAPVQLVGINVGFIDSISFEDLKVNPVSIDAKEGGEDASSTEGDFKTIVKVKVTMKIDSQYSERIRSDSVASVITQGLLGDRMVSITVGSNSRKKLGDGDEIIEVRNPTGFTQLVQKGDDLMLGAKDFMNDSQKMVQNVNAILTEIIKGEGLVHDVIYDKRSGKSLEQLNAILTNLQGMSHNLNRITGKINNGKGTLGAIVNDDSLYQDVKTLMGKANRNRLIRSVIQYTIKTKEKEQLK